MHLSRVVFYVLLLAGCPGGLCTAGAASGLSARAIEEFLVHPAALLAQYPDGESALVSKIRDLAVSDQATLNPIIDLLATANAAQTQAIGTGLGQAALLVAKTDQAYAAMIREILVAAIGKTQIGGARELGSALPKIGHTVTVENQAEGTTERGTQSLYSGTGVYLNELVRTGVASKAEFVFSDRTNLTVAPVTEIHLDQYVYNPGQNGNVLVVATSGAFRFITGVQPHEDYAIRTPFATMGVRGTEFIVVISPEMVRIQLSSGEVVVTTISNKVVVLTTPGSVLSVDSNGNTQDEPPTRQPLVNFADLGPPVTNTRLADALDAFSAATLDTTGGTGGGGEGGSGPNIQFSGGGFLPSNGNSNLSTASVTVPDSFQSTTLSLTTPPSANSMMTSGTTLNTTTPGTLRTLSQSVSPSR